MKKMILLALVFLLSSNVLAQGDRVGIYADPAATDREVHVIPWEPIHVFFIAHVPSFPEGIRAVECRIFGWPLDPGYPIGGIGYEWECGSRLGDMYGDWMAFAWAEPVLPDANGNVLIGALRLTSYSDGWPECDIYIKLCNGFYETPVVVDHQCHLHPIEGDIFMINPRSITAVEMSTMSRLKALY